MWRRAHPRSSGKDLALPPATKEGDAVPCKVVSSRTVGNVADHSLSASSELPPEETRGGIDSEASLVALLMLTFSM